MVTFIFLYHQIYRNTPSRSSNNQVNSKHAITLGIFGGLFGVVLLHFAIEANENTLIDLRTVPLMLMAIYGGRRSTAIAGVIIILYRFMLGVNPSSFANLFLIIGSAIIFLYVAKRITNIWKSVVTMLILSNIVFSIVTYPLFDNFYIYFIFNISYWFIMIVAGLLAVYINRYLIQSNKLFSEYH